MGRTETIFAVSVLALQAATAAGVGYGAYKLHKDDAKFKAIAEVAVETNRLAGLAVDEAAEAKDAAYSAFDAAETAAGSVDEYCGD